jgi:hypothetical protein
MELLKFLCLSSYEFLIQRTVSSSFLHNVQQKRISIYAKTLVLSANIFVNNVVIVDDADLFII